MVIIRYNVRNVKLACHPICVSIKAPITGATGRINVIAIDK